MSQVTVSDDVVDAGGGHRVMQVAAAVAAVGALGVSGYLTAVSLAGGVEPVGCGAGSGCAEVLSSRWSRVAGVPVSLPAVALYAVMLVGLAMIARPMGRGLVMTSGAAVVAAAGWFVFVQATWLGAWCGYCLTAHGLGVLAVMLGLAAAWQAGPWRVGVMGSAAAIGVAAVIGLATLQVLASEPVHRLAMLDEQWTPGEQPVIGPADAERYLLVMVDYACPHCRHTHGVLLEARERMQPAPSLVVLPVPLNPACNEHAPMYPAPRFAESCELARLALAVHLADAAQFEAFDRWLFEPELPRTAEQSEAEAARLVGASALAQALADPRIDAMLARNTAAYGRSGADRLPVTLAPDVEPVVGRIEQVETVLRLFEPGEAAD